MNMRGELVDRMLSFVTLAVIAGGVLWLNDRARERAEHLLAVIVTESTELLTTGASNALRQVDDHLVGRSDSLWPVFFVAGLVLVWCLTRLEHR